MIDVDAQPSNRGSNSLVVPTVSPLHQRATSSFVALSWARILLSSCRIDAWNGHSSLLACLLSGCVVSVAAQWVIRFHFQESLVLVAGSSAPCSSPISHQVILECGVPVASFALCVNPQSRLVLQDCERPQPNWFTHGPLSTFGHLYGWRAVPISLPGSGSQSWLLCPLITWFVGS